MARSVLDSARRLARRGRTAEVISLLESRLPLFRDSAPYYFLLGSSCLRTGDLGGAATYLKRAEQLDPLDRDTRLHLAALHLKRGETDKAISIYLALLEDRPGDRLAGRALERLRHSPPELLQGGLADRRELAAYLPPPRGFPPWLLPALLVLALILAFAALLPLAGDLAALVARKAAPRPEIAALSLSAADTKAPVGAAGSARYILTEAEALAAFEKAKSRFQEYRDNAALVEINRLLESNATPSLKEKARTLLQYVGAPDWRTLRDIPSFDSVRAEPLLYQGVAVLWQGRAANLRKEGGSRSFDFLVGYADRSRLDGIITVRVGDAATVVPPEAPFEVLGRIQVRAGGFGIDALALHELSEKK